MRGRLRLLLLLVLVVAAACARAGGESAAGPSAVRLGYFPNLTHAAALVGVEKGIFRRHLGPGIRFETSVFNAGPSAVEALFSGQVDAAYIGPNPAINAFQRSRGQAIRIVAGAASGGAALVVRPGIDGPGDLKGRRIATPQLGNTQDVALRAWLARQGLEADARGGGDVSILPQENAQSLEAFRLGHVDGAWVPEPWVTRLVVEAGGTVLVDEADLWPGGRFLTAALAVRTEYLRANPDAVRRLLRAHVAATQFVSGHPEESREAAGAAIRRVSGKALAPAVMERAWSRLSFTYEPLAATLQKQADDATAAGLLPHVDLDAIYDLGPLNAVLREAGRPEVTP